MSQSTFSGPIRSGTQRDGGPQAGQPFPLQGFNVGRPILTQIVTVPLANMLSAGSTFTAFNLPAGAKVLGFDVEETVALVTATNLGLTVGNGAILNAAGGTILAASPNSLVTSFNTGATVGKVAQATIDTALQVLLANNIGTYDMPVTITATAAIANATAGSVTCTLRYVQRNADGT